MYNLFRNEWKRLRLTKQIQAANRLYNIKIESAPSPLQKSLIYRQKVDSIYEIAARYLDRNRPG